MQRTKKLERFLRFRGAVHSLIAGEIRSAKTCLAGIEFDQLRAYEPGDSPGAINLIASARRGKLMVAERLPERELDFVLALDESPSVLFGSVNLVKAEAASELADVVVQSVAQYERPRMFLIKESDGRLKCDPFTKQKDVHQGQQIKNFNLSEILRFVRKRGGKTTFLFIISDFLFPADYARELRSFRRAGHFAAAVALVDQMERNEFFIKFGAIRARDLETGKEKYITQIRDTDWVTKHENIFKAQRFRMLVICTTEKGE